MSNLSSLNKTNQLIISEISRIKRGGSKQEKKPHKLIMLLSVLDLIEAGRIKSNQIFYNEELINAFEANFRMLAKVDDWCQPAIPFFHLRSASFWKHKIIPGREAIYDKLDTSGGGSKRILENIEYAYLDESTFSAFMNHDSRREIRAFILKMLTNRIPTLFHESFSLSRPSMYQILKAIKELKIDNVFLKRKSDREKYFFNSTSLGNNYIRSMPNYCKGAGLIDFDYLLTEFGKLVISYDDHLNHIGTQWLMHYHLSAPHGPGPAFWNDAVSRFFYAGNIFTDEELIEAIGNFVWQNENRILAKRSVQSTARVFLGTYLKPEGLNNLRLLEMTEGGRYRVCEPNPAPIWAIAYALVDYWQANYPGRLGIGLDTLLESSFLKLFLIGKSRMMEVLQAMQETGYIQIHRTAPPYQVLLGQQDQEGILKKIYGTE